MLKNKTSLFVRLFAVFALLLFTGFVSTAQAQITFDSSASVSSDGNPVSWSHTVGTGNNRVLVVTLSHNAGNPYPSAASVTYAGQNLTRQVLIGGNNPISEIWTLVAPQVGANQVVVTYSGPSGGKIGSSFSYFGVNQATPLRGANQSRQSSFSTSIQISTSVGSSSGDLVIDVIAALGVYLSPNNTPGAGQTLLLESPYGSLYSGTSSKSGESGSTTMSWTFSSPGLPTDYSLSHSVISLIPAVTTAASVSISGRVLTNSRRGLSNTVVYLTDSQGNTHTARTSSFGYYRFNDIAAGQSVTITVVSKRYQFAPQIVNVNEEMNGLNFLADN